ncbi:MAG: beta-Ala-His dipeptidase [Clostridia bacterium]|nr:beta-Ala-His dipeptidase [Clostridia bacterium]
MRKCVKSLFICLFSLEMVFTLISCVDQKAENGLSDDEVINLVIDNFMPLSEIPRQSHHEETVSQYLMDWAAFNGLEPKRDNLNNVMFDVPATEGMENKPLGILQGHMDMVVAVADNKEFNPLRDAVTVIRNDDNKTLTAEGTSLGADDGIGLAIIKSVVQGKMNHGPLRIIITVNEEDGMTGASNVDESWLDGAVFLINIDNETSDQVLVSTAAGNNLNISENVSFVSPVSDTALSLEISNLRGGHSGVDIDKGRLNGIRGLTYFLVRLDENDIKYELASFEGGTASNAIPTKAKAVIVINETDKAGVTALFNGYKNELAETYAGIEEIVFELKDSSPVTKVADDSVKAGFVNFITSVNDGVKDFSEDIPGLVESSSNLGVAKLDPVSQTVEITTFMRSSKVAIETLMLNNQVALAEECGFSPGYTHTADAWQFDPDSKLLEIAKDVYKKQNGTDVVVAAVHAGVECGCFKKIKPTIDMISIGPDISDSHTINETLYLDSIPGTWRLLEGLLADYYV